MFIYQTDIAIINNYEGYEPLNLSISVFSIIFAGLIIVFFSIPKNIKVPSDFFLLIYSIFVLLSAVLFSTSTQLLDEIDIILLFLILYIPLAIVFFFRKLRFQFTSVEIITYKLKIRILIIWIVVSTLIAYQMGSGIGSFDFVSLYDRRLEGRDIFKGGAFISYIISIAINGITPLFAFVGICKKRSLFIIIALLSSVFDFWLLGLKSPFANVLFFTLLGYLFRKKIDQSLSMYLIYIFIFICSISIIEYYFWNISVVSQLIVRRIFVVQAEVQSFYFDAIKIFLSKDFGKFVNGYSLNTNYSDITYFIGYNYLNNSATNANSNSFLYFFLKKGILGYMLNFIVVGLFFMIIDNLYIKKKEPEYLFLGCLYSILLTEQSYTTAMVSSGIFLILILSLITKLNK